jgi:enterochelin esterase-like enzyme
MREIIFFLFSVSIFGFSYSQIDTAIYSVETNLYQTNTISGSLKTIEWKSESMQEIRTISIYEPVGFHKDSTYNVVIVTDNQCEALANALENRMMNNEIKPLLIIGINNREPQITDSIFGDKNIDFRTSEMTGFVFSTEIDFKNVNAVKLLSNRVPKFHDYIVNEISNYVIEHYNVTEKINWTLGGFSNGGFAVTNIATIFPDSFGYIIAMSPAGGEMNKVYDFDYSKTKSKFFISAGIDEGSFHKRSIELAKDLDKNGVDFEHKSFKAGHDYNMWLTYYVECLRKIYRK